MNRILELWSGTSSGTRPWADRGYEIVTVDNDPKYNPTICKDILDVTLEDLEEFGPFDFVWASPECRTYSVANMHSGHWLNGIAATEAARASNVRVKHTLYLLENLDTPFWVLENPRGMLRTQNFMNKYHRVTVTYCQYGDFRMKPTDLWGKFPRMWVPIPMCKRGASCHEAAPRGTKNGVQRQSREQRIVIPYALPLSLYEAARFSDEEAWAVLEV